MPFYLLLAMQAAGMVVDYLGVKNQEMFAKMGLDVTQAGIDANIQQTRLETEDASLQSLKHLRQTLGSQIASYAARGTFTGAGNALGKLTESQGNFDSDERIRRLNLLGKENALKAGAAISRLNYMSENSKLWQGFASRTINRFSSQQFSGGGSGATGKQFGMSNIGE